MSFRKMYLQAYDELEKAFKGKEFDSDSLDLNKIYQSTIEFHDEVWATFDSKVINPERSITKVYYEVVCYCLLVFKELHVSYRYTHWETDPFIKVYWCFEQLSSLAEGIRILAEAEGIELKRFSDLNLQRDYALGFTYKGSENGGTKKLAFLKSINKITEQRDQKGSEVNCLKDHPPLSALDALLVYFKEDKREIAKEKILPFLKENFRNLKGKGLAAAWFGLYVSGLIIHPRGSGTVKALHTALGDYLEGDNGYYGGFNNDGMNHFNTLTNLENDKEITEWRDRYQILLDL